MSAANGSAIESLADGLRRFLLTGIADEEVFAADVFVDFTLPQWWVQLTGRDALVNLRLRSHPAMGSVPSWRVDPTPSGFVAEFTERWNADDGDWYCREMARADVTDGRISALSVYCTGDWDPALQAKHRQAVTLLRP
ncbi:MAG TPA: hypothetical protein VFW71_01925 [Actinomycetota bacterium]|nr:hypothetical protein [Actinomycetota bacterium]